MSECTHAPRSPCLHRFTGNSNAVQMCKKRMSCRGLAWLACPSMACTGLQGLKKRNSWTYAGRCLYKYTVCKKASASPVFQLFNSNVLSLNLMQEKCHIIRTLHYRICMKINCTPAVFHLLLIACIACMGRVGCGRDRCCQWWENVAGAKWKAFLPHTSIIFMDGSAF